MKRMLFIIFFMVAFSLTAVAAKYKVNTSGKVTSPDGKVQKGSVLMNNSNFYRNYNAQYYTGTKQVLVNQVGTIDIVMDYSGSMLNWINAAKSSMSQIVAQLPPSTQIGFRVFGQNTGNNPYKPNMGTIKNIVKDRNGKYKVNTKTADYLGNIYGACSATSRVASLSTNNSQALLKGMNSVKIGGATPLTYGLEQAVNQDFAGLATNFPKKIVLITDGGENCGGDPCEFARNLMRQRNDIHIDVVLVSSYSKELKCISDATGGEFYTTSDVSSFSNILIQSMQSVPQQVNTPVQKQKYEFIEN